LRQALRLTVRDFAEDLGIDPRTVSKWEARGGMRSPRPELQAALDSLLARATSDERTRFSAVIDEGGQTDGWPPSLTMRLVDGYRHIQGLLEHLLQDAEEVMAVTRAPRR
jgi:transcriptional regulator with XRE-family HTH domain